MKKLKLYEKLGLKNDSDVFDFFIKTLRESIFTWEFFVDWGKIAVKVEEFETELNILNSLIGKHNSETKFVELLKEYPRTRGVLPLLIAVRLEKLRKVPIADDTDINNTRAELKKDYFRIRGNVDEKTTSELKRFYVESGLKNVLEEKNVKSLVDYYTGVEVGMDTNARKNRVGDIMEDIMENYLSDAFSKYEDIEVIPQANRDKIKRKWEQTIRMDKTSRIFDFAIFNKRSDNLFLVETNFYSGGGTKLKSTTGEYRQLAESLNQQGLPLVWVTDGLGWHTARNPLRETFHKNNFVFNLRFVTEGALQELVLE